MDNVYGEVAAFYAKNTDAEDSMPRELIEKYLRKCAWSGTADEELKAIWQVLVCGLTYLDENEIFSLEFLNIYDYQEMLYDGKYQPRKELITEEAVKGFFAYLRPFYSYLQANGYGDYIEVLERAQASFYDEGEFVGPETDGHDEFYRDLVHLDNLSFEDAERLNGMLEKLLNHVGEYYRQPEFVTDLTRALTLYSGPFEISDEDTKENEEFWFSFWDYFFFDYHLLRTDLTPLQYYFEQEKDKLQASERYILRDLLKAKFTVFSIDFAEDEFVQCTNLFTGEKIDLPIPDYGMTDYSRMLLFGHLHLHGVMMLNYITSVSASEKLRKRIKEEVLRQYEIFRCQEPNAGLGDFFRRHAAAVRHTINILASYAQLKVVSARPQRAVVERHACRLAPADKEAFLKAARILGISLYSQKLALWLYEDALSLPELVDYSTQPAEILTAVFILFMNVNGMEFMDPAAIMKNLGADEETTFKLVEIIYEGVGCDPFDPRYLAEEGFVQGLYTV